MKKRVEKIFENFKEKPEMILIKNSSEPYIDHNFFYVTGLEKGLFEGSIAVLYPDGNIDLIVSKLEEESAGKADVNIMVYNNKEEFNDLLKTSIKDVRVAGLNFDGILHKDYNKFKDMFPKTNFFDVSKVFAKTRAVKDKSEINLIKKACEIVDKVICEIPSILQEEMFEYNLAAEINYIIQKNGADKSAFETISSFGSNSAEPHYTHGNTRLKKNDFVLCDFGACFRRYNSDITRTFVFGKANDKQKDMYETVLKAQKIGLEKIKPGIKAHEVHDAVKSYIDRSKFKGCFIHSTGHSLGLAVHDGGVGFTPESDAKLCENMVLTVEPGVYIPGFGGVRIEDDILIKKDGAEFLTQSSKEFTEI